jgi:hypothetical protein
MEGEGGRMSRLSSKQRRAARRRRAGWPARVAEILIQGGRRNGWIAGMELVALSARVSLVEVWSKLEDAGWVPARNQYALVQKARA